MTFYLKYRPQKLDDLDILSVRNTLVNILKSGTIPHAYLFAGPKGTGKTSAARILAKAINCESKNPPCNKCDQCVSITNGTNIDVIEMDAASNRGIDDIRALRDIIKLAPAKAKSKIYIIDEAHMLTIEASNALLKTLEEPPSHVYFILATTNPEKLIETIKSRTTLIHFTKATADEISRSLKRVVDGEKMKISEEDLKIIAKMSKGSFRDAVKILEQVSVDKNLLKNSKSFNVDNFLELLNKKDLKKSLNELSSAIKEGISVELITESVLEKLRFELLALSGIGSNEYKFTKLELIQLIEFIIQSQENIKLSPVEELPLELAIIKWFGDDGEVDIGDGDINDDKKDETTEKQNTKVLKDDIKLSDTNIENSTPSEFNIPEVSIEYWTKILAEVKLINASIEALLRSSKPIGFDGQRLKLGVYYKFHKDKLEELINKKLLEDIATKIFEKTIRIECLLTEPPAKIQLTESKDDNILNVAEEIFNV